MLFICKVNPIQFYVIFRENMTGGTKYENDQRSSGGYGVQISEFKGNLFLNEQRARSKSEPGILSTQGTHKETQTDPDSSTQDNGTQTDPDSFSDKTSNCFIKNSKNENDLLQVIHSTDFSTRQFWETELCVEEESWNKEHDLKIDEKKRDEMLSKIPKAGQHVKLCACERIISTKPRGGSIKYEHWFILNEENKSIIEFDYVTKIVQIRDFGDGQNYTQSEIIPRRTFPFGQIMIDNLKKVLGATNFSFLLRNSEHVVNYICAGSWKSFQCYIEKPLNQKNGSIIRHLLKKYKKKKGDENRDCFPSELKPKSEKLGWFLLRFPRLSTLKKKSYLYKLRQGSFDSPQDKSRVFQRGGGGVTRM